MNVWQDVKPKIIKSGVPQGSVLGLCPFLLYVDNLPKNLTSTTRLFANDMACHKIINKAADQQELQKDMDKPADWEDRWLIPST